MPGKITSIVKKLLLLLGAVGGTGLLALWAQNGSMPLLAPEPSRAPAAAAATAASLDEAHNFQPEAGQRYIYSFERKIAFQSEPGTPSLPEIRYGGDFFVDVLRADSRSFEALLSERVAEAGGKPSPPLRMESGSRGDSLVLFTTGFGTSDEAQHISILKDLASLWLFPLRSDTVGNYEARFEPLPNENGASMEKKIKLAYKAEGAISPEILSSLHFLRWDGSIHLPAEVKGSETTRLGESGSGFTAVSKYNILFRAKEKSPAFGHELLASLNREEELKLNTRSANLSEHPDYAHLDWNNLLAQLRGIDKLDGGEQLALFGDLLRYTRLHPEKIAELAGFLRDPTILRLGISSPTFKTLVGALATLGSPEALGALREAYEDPALAATGKGSILAALTTTQAQLDSATRDFLAQKMQSEKDPHLSQGAGFALGSSLQSAANDEQANRSIGLLEDRWKAVSETNRTGDQLSLLDMMGNSGRAEFLPELESVISSDKDPSLRARAVFSLRFINNPGSISEIIARLSDPEPLVREAAAGAIDLANWNEGFRHPLETCSASEAVSRIQDACRKTLEKNTRLAFSH